MNDTVIEQPVEPVSDMSIGDSIRAAMEPQEAPTEVPQTEEQVLDNLQEQIIEPPEGETLEYQGLEASEFWPEDIRQRFRDLDPSVQEMMLELDKSKEAAWTKKTTALAEERKGLGRLVEYEAVDQLFAPHLNDLKLQGITPAQMINQWAQVHQALQSNPQDTLKQLAAQYNVNFDAEESGDTFENPEIAGLKQQLSQLQQSMAQREQQAYQSQQDSMIDQITKFSQATNEDGSLKHPHYDAVVNDMVLLAQAARANGQEPSLDELYDRAVWSNTAIREQMQKAQQDAALEAQNKAAREKAAQAQSASKSINGTRTGDVNVDSDLSLRQLLNKQFRS